MLKENNIRWQYFIKLSFWGESGLNWHTFMKIWKEYQEGFDNSLDRRAIEYIAAKCQNDSVFNYAVNLQRSKIKADSTNIENYVLLASLLLRSDTEAADRLYTRAITMVHNNQSKMDQITSSRFQTSLQYDYSVFHKAMGFMKIYSPTIYSQNSNFLKAGYFEKHQEWKNFTKAVNNYIQKIGGPDSIKNTELFANYAHFINVNVVKNQYCIRSAYKWSELVLKIEPDNERYKKLYHSLKNKLR